MASFYLIQRGTFRETGTSLTGKDGVVDLDYMGSFEFEHHAIPKAYRRLMYDFTDYSVFPVGIHTPEGDELMVFCQKEYSSAVVSAIRQYINQPYLLKKYSELDTVPYAKQDDTSLPWNTRRSNFWWCIDIGVPYGDWIAFLEPQTELLIKALENDYQNWWMKKTPEDREEDYEKSLD